MDETPDRLPGVDPELLSGADDETLRAQVTELERVAAAASDATLVVDESGVVQSADEGVESLLGYEPDTVVGWSLASLVASCRVPDVFEVTSPETLQERLTETAELSGLSVPLEGSDGRPVAVSLSTVSVPERPGRVCLLRHESPADPSGFAGAAAEVAGDPVYALDERGTIVWANEAMSRYTGHEQADLPGRSVRDLVPDETYRQATETVLELAADPDRNVERLETELHTSTGDSVLTEATVVALTDEDGEFAGSVGVLHDITERAERERDLELLKKVLTRVFRHNVRNELTIIQGHAEMVGLADDETLAAHGDRILESATRLREHSEKARLIERVLETEAVAEMDLVREVEATVRSLDRDYPDATLDVDLPEQMMVEAHPEIRRAIEELVENAIVHTPSEVDTDATVWLETDETVTLYVEDNAGGLGDHELEVVRTGEETNLRHGSGVGLWLVHWLVESSGADLLASRVDNGTRIGVEFDRPGSGL